MEKTTDMRVQQDLDVRPSYRPGTQIALHDFLALWEEGVDYDRDERGRLTLMSPESMPEHRIPINVLHEQIVLAKPPQFKVIQEAAIAFEPIFRLGDDAPLPASFLGRKWLEVDMACFDRRPIALMDPVPGRPRPVGKYLKTEGLKLVVEALSPGTWDADLGLGYRDAVDRMRTYAENNVPEYWIMNFGFEAPCPVPPRSALLLARDPDRPLYFSLPVENGRIVAEVRGLPVYGAGQVRSVAVPGVTIDLERLWEEARIAIEGEGQ